MPRSSGGGKTLTVPFCVRQKAFRACAPQNATLVPLDANRTGNDAETKGHRNHRGLEAERGPVLITQHRRPAAYLVAVETYEDMQRRLAILEGIAWGERAIE